MTPAIALPVNAGFNAMFDSLLLLALGCALDDHQQINKTLAAKERVRTGIGASCEAVAPPQL